MNSPRNIQARTAMDRASGTVYLAEITDATIENYEIAAKYCVTYYGSNRYVTVPVITFVDTPTYDVGELILIVKGEGFHPYTSVFGNYWFDVNIIGRIPSTWFATPEDTGISNSEGEDDTFVRGDHVHKAIWQAY